MTTQISPRAAVQFGADPYDLASFEQWMWSWGASPNTIETRMVVASKAALKWPDPGMVTPSDITEFLADPKFHGWTRTTYFGHLRCLFRWLHDREAIPKDPTAKLRRPRPPKSRPRPLSPDEARRAVDAATGNLRTWLLLGLYEGLRVHEVAKLQGRDVTEEMLYVRGKGGKDATVPTHPVVWELAESYPRVGFWFPGQGALITRATPVSTHVQSDWITTATTAHFRGLGIEGSFHRCRHTYATNLLRAGVNLRVVQTLMRHEDISSTAAYLAVDEDERTAAVRLIGMPS